MMRRILSERNIVVVLFVMVLITFSLAHEDCKQMERIYLGFNKSISEPVASLADNKLAKSPVTAPSFNQ